MAGPHRFDITRVRLQNYRSIARCDVHRGALTLLVGPNGAGKSNFIDCLRLTSQALTENLDNALRERGGVAEVRRRSTGHPTHFAVSLDFSFAGHVGRYAFQVAAVRGGDYRVSRESCELKEVAFGGAEHHYAVRDGQVLLTSEPVLPRTNDDRLFLVAVSGLESFRPVFDGLAGVNVFNLNPEMMRQLQKPDAGDMLRRDGSNVASVLERLRRETPAIKQRVEDYLRHIVPDIDSADRRGLGAWESVEFRQHVAGSSGPWTFPATSMSDGTLRALGVLVALFASGGSAFSPISIEEPEVALHPAAAGLLLEALSMASEHRQVVATSHSPDLLDSSTLTREQILAVRADSGETRIARPDHAASEALRERLFTAGELLRVDQLPPEPVRAAQTELF